MAGMHTKPVNNPESPPCTIEPVSVCPFDPVACEPSPIHAYTATIDDVTGRGITLEDAVADLNAKLRTADTPALRALAASLKGERDIHAGDEPVIVPKREK